MNLQEYLLMYGYKGLNLLVEEFIKRAPQFPGDEELATLIGTAMADLESALRQAVEKR